MAKETKEERRARIEKEVAERSAARRAAQEEARKATIEQAKTATGLKEGYEFYAKSTAGGGFELAQKPTKETLKQAWTTIVTPPDQRVYTPKVGSNIYQMLGGTLYFSGTPFTGTTAEGTKYVGGQAFSGIDPENKNNRYSKGLLAATRDPVTGQWSLTKEGKKLKLNLDPDTGGILESPDADMETGMGAGSSASFAQQAAEAATRANRESAFALLKLEFDKYGLGSLVDTVKNYIMQGSPVEEVTLKLRETPEYQARFAGNQARLKAGLNVYDEATYLELENAYDQVFTSYGVTEAAGNTVEARRARYAQFIGGTISPDEVKSRVQLAVAAANEDEVTKATLRELYPMISDKDIVSYFLNPKETLPKLETKVRASQIGAAAVRQGLVTNVATAEELAAMGITEQEAERAYSAYAGMKPTLDLLSGLEKDQELAVNQQVAEGALLKGLASEQRKLEGLRQKELARFSGSAGTARGVSLGSQLGGTY